MDNTFITYQKALSILASHASELPEETRQLEACVGAYLAEDLKADRDFPPFDRVTMDGIAISYASFARGQREFSIQETAPALEQCQKGADALATQHHNTAGPSEGSIAYSHPTPL